jgi:hypothetical protein
VVTEMPTDMPSNPNRSAWSAEESATIKALTTDLSITLGAVPGELVEETAIRLRLSNPSPELFEELLVEQVQQSIHDDFIDTGWPRCPDHPNHPLWFDHGWWTCATTAKRVARLGELLQSAGG